MSTDNLLPGTRTPVQLLYPDLAQEFASTRRMLERVPDGNDAWKPHDKSMTLGRLASHLAELPNFTTLILRTDDLDWETFKYVPVVLESTAARLAEFDARSGEMAAALEGADWAALSKEWSMRSGSQVFVKDVKSTLVRTFGLSHMAHHRAQLGVYLRQLGVPVPGMYGPSADEM
jgi:uncharacterized damage-inducible protein DinB